MRPLFLAVSVIVNLTMLRHLAYAQDAAANAAAPGWVARSWSREDGLPQDSVAALAQTRDQFLWVGTPAGLARFDGVSFRLFGLRDGLRSVYITALAADRTGALWIGTSGGGISRWEAGRFTSFGPEEGFPAGLEIVSLAADRDGSVWIGTDKGLVHWSAGNFKVIGEKEGLPRKQVSALLHDSNGTLWASVLLGGLFRSTEAGHFARVSGSDPHPGSVYCLFEDRAGAIWAGSDSLWKWNGTGWTRFNTANGLSGLIFSIGESSDGTLWVGTRSRGLYRSTATGDRFEPVISDNSLGVQSVRAMLTDREGSVWVGSTGAGLYRFSPRLLQFWSSDAGLESTTVTSVVEDPTGTLWAGTSTRGIQRFAEGHFTPFQDPALSANNPIIYCTAATTDGAVWLAGEGRLFRIQSGEVKTFRDPPVSGEAIRALCADGEVLWLGTYASTLLKCDAEGVRVIAPAGSFPGTITSISLETAETLWVGTSAGLHYWQNGKIRTWTTRDGLLTGYIRALHRDPDGTLWIGTLGGGLTRMRQGRFVHFTTAEGLIDDTVSQIVADDFGALWLGSNRGLMRIDRRELDAVADGKASELHPIGFGRNEGMLKEQCFGGTSPTAIKARDGRLYFPTVNGLTEIDPRRLQSLRPTAPRVSIEEILVDERLHAPGAALVIPPGKHRLEIAYTAPVLNGGEWVQFRHRLEGFETEWRSAARTRRASYPGLPPGRYSFQVAAADQAGNWREARESLAFKVQPFFWETLWFQAGGILLLIGASGAGTWRHLHRKHRRQLAELERERQVQADLAEARQVAFQLTADLRVAHDIQMGMIPHDFSVLEKDFGVELAGALDPAREVGGDLYCAFAAESGRLVLIMGDVSGKGIPASLFMVRASTLARLLASQIREPDRLLAALNDQLAAENPSMMFCTLVCAIFDKATHCLELVNGGHTLPVLLRKNEPPTWAVPALNPALGFLPGTRFEQKELLLTQGDTVVLYTDGVSEAFNRRRERYGNERLLKTLTASNGAAASGVVAQLLADVRTFSDGAPQSDDIAVLVLRLAEPALAGAGV